MYIGRVVIHQTTAEDLAGSCACIHIIIVGAVDVRPVLIPPARRRQIALLAVGRLHHRSETLQQLRLNSGVAKRVSGPTAGLVTDAPLFEEAGEVVAGAVHTRRTRPPRLVALAL